MVISQRLFNCMWSAYRRRYSDWLRVGRSGDPIPVGARFSAPVQTGPGAHPASCTMGTGSFPGVKSNRGVTLTPQPLPVPWSRKSIAIPLLPVWAVRPAQSLSACTMCTLPLPLTFFNCITLVKWRDSRDACERLGRTIMTRQITPDRDCWVFHYVTRKCNCVSELRVWRKFWELYCV